ncbi:MAG: AsmA family protein [Usitatibacter sp.]
MNLRKVALWGMGTLVFLAAAGGVALKVLVDPEHLRKMASERAQSALHRDLKVSDIQFNLFPLPSVAVRDLELTHATEPPLKARSVTVGLQLLPLLIGKARYRSAWFNEVDLQLDGAKWRIEEAMVDIDEDMRDVKVVARIWRDDHAVSINAFVADLSQAGKQGASSDAVVELDFGTTRMNAKGKVPVDGSARNFDVAVDIKSTALEDMNAFFGSKRKPRVPFTATFNAREADGKVSIEKIEIALGELKAHGDAQYTPGPTPFTAVRISSDRVDWAKALYEAGNDNMLPPESPQMFHDTPLAWWMVSALHGKKGIVDATFGTLILRNGVKMKNLKMKATYNDDHLDVTRWDSEMLGGTASGRIQLDGDRNAVVFDFEGSNLLLERWLTERKSRVKFKDGPMKVTAKVRATGPSMRKLVATLDGPIDIRMGKGTLINEGAGEAEAKLTGGGVDGPQPVVNFECVGYALDFHNGRAEGESIIGARTTDSHLLASGWVDMSSQTLDLRGRIKGTSGIGLAAIVGDVKITGPIRTPRVRPDEQALPKAVVRGAAAVATLGLSAVATAAADSREAKANDPCEAVFRKSPT